MEEMCLQKKWLVFFKQKLLNVQTYVFEFASKHELGDSEGLYECPACREANLEVENIRLRKVIKEALEIAKGNVLASPACSDIEVILSKTLSCNYREFQ